MEFISDMGFKLTKMSSDYFAPAIATLIATWLVIYGNDLNRAVKMKIVSYPFVVRVAIFMVLCVVGFGFAIVPGAKLLHNLLVDIIQPAWRAYLMIGLFIMTGILADRKKQI